MVVGRSELYVDLCLQLLTKVPTVDIWLILALSNVSTYLGLLQGRAGLRVALEVISCAVDEARRFIKP